MVYEQEGVNNSFIVRQSLIPRTTKLLMPSINKSLTLSKAAGSLRAKNSAVPASIPLKSCLDKSSDWGKVWTHSSSSALIFCGILLPQYSQNNPVRESKLWPSNWPKVTLAGFMVEIWTWVRPTLSNVLHCSTCSDSFLWILSHVYLI